jgi:hypothetical protein
VHERILDGLKREPLWKHYFQAPELKMAKPGPAPLLVLPTVPTRALTLHIDPDAAAEGTNVILSIRGYALDQRFCYPLNQNHETVYLQPQQYVVEASSKAGSPEPKEAVVDVRRTREHTIRILSPALPAAGAPPIPSVPEAPPPDVERIQMLGFWSDSGAIEAVALEPQAAVSIRSLEAPYSEWSGHGILEVAAPAGPYHVEFRLGTDVFSKTDVYVRPASRLVVSAKAAMTPLMSEAMGATEVPHAAVLSESIGPMQASLLSTVLAIIGVKVFDINRELFSQFRDLIEPRDASALGDMPLSVVIAADGQDWQQPVEKILDGLGCEVVTAGSASQRVAWHRLSRGTFFDTAGLPSEGLGRIRVVYGRAPASEFEVNLQCLDLAQS